MKRTDGDVQETDLLLPQSQRFNSLLSFLVSRQTTELEDDEDDEDEEDEEEHCNPENSEPTSNPVTQANQAIETLSLDEKFEQLPNLLPQNADSVAWAGFNGRANKIADTCYCFWVTGALDVRARLLFISLSSPANLILDY